jgi:hypothetical protein
MGSMRAEVVEAVVVDVVALRVVVVLEKVETLVSW